MRVAEVRSVKESVDPASEKAGVGTLRYGLKSRAGKEPKSIADIHGHRTLKAPHPVRSAKLTRVPPS